MQVRFIFTTQALIVMVMQMSRGMGSAAQVNCSNYPQIFDEMFKVEYGVRVNGVLIADPNMSLYISLSCIFNGLLDV